MLLYLELDVVGSKHVTGESSEHAIAAPPSLLGPSAAHIIANWLIVLPLPSVQATLYHGHKTGLKKY